MGGQGAAQSGLPVAPLLQTVAVLCRPLPAALVKGQEARLRPLLLLPRLQWLPQPLHTLPPAAWKESSNQHPLVLQTFRSACCHVTCILAYLLAAVSSPDPPCWPDLQLAGKPLVFGRGGAQLLLVGAQGQRNLQLLLLRYLQGVRLHGAGTNTTAQHQGLIRVPTGGSGGNGGGGRDYQRCC